MSQPYVFGKVVAMSYEQAVERATHALAAEGFGVLTEIDVAATLKKKLGKEVPPYTILGACNPQLADRALAVEPTIGALLPCNVVVRRTSEGETRVEIMDPKAVLGMVDNPAIAGIAGDVRARLARVLDAL